MRSVIYARISEASRDKDEPPTPGIKSEVGVNRQIDSCREFAVRHSLEVTKVYTDNDISAYSGKRRPAFEELLGAMANREFSVLIVWHIDRLCRSPRELERIVDAADTGGVKIKTVNSGDLDLSTSSGRMNARLLGSVARYESEHHAERRREANKARALAGAWRREGSRPFGYDKNGVPIEGEAMLIRRAATDILSGKSLHAVAREWNLSGNTTVRGKRWTNLHVRRVLKNACIAALCVYRGEIVGPGRWEAILDESLWRGLVAFMEDPSRRTGVAFEKKYLGSGLYKCGVCLAPLYAAHPHGRGRSMTYVCKQPGSHIGRNGAALDEYVESVACNYLNEMGLGNDLRNGDDDLDREKLRTDRLALKETKGQLATLLRKGILDFAEVEREAAIITTQINDIDKKLADSMSVHPAVAIFTADDEAPADLAFETLLQRWKAAAPDLRAKAISALMDVVVHRSPPGSRKFDPDLIEIRWRTNL